MDAVEERKTRMFNSIDLNCRYVCFLVINKSPDNCRFPNEPSFKYSLQYKQKRGAVLQINRVVCYFKNSVHYRRHGAGRQ